MTARVMALETMLTEKGLVDPAALDEIVELYERQIGPKNGAQVVARAWSDPEFAEWLRRDATAAIASMGYGGRQGEHMHAVSTPRASTTSSSARSAPAIPGACSGCRRSGTSRRAYRSRAVHRPARGAGGVRAGAPTRHRDPGLGLHRRAALPGGADAPAGSEGLDEAALAGARHPRLDDRHRPAAARHERAAGPRRARRGSGRSRPSADEPVFHAPWERRALALTLGAGAMGHWTIDESRHARESLHPADYYASSYYAIWIKALERLLVRHGFVTAAELAAGRALEPRRRAEAGAAAPAEVRGRARARHALRPRPGRRAAGLRARRRGCAPWSCIPRATPGCRATRAASSGGSRRCSGFHVFPDATRTGAARRRSGSTPSSSTRRELWGRDADPGEPVSIDAWESYLEPA